MSRPAVIESDAVWGQMQRGRLTVASIAARAESTFALSMVVERTAEGIRWTTYGAVAERARRLASALLRLGVKPGDRVATFGWNTAAHLELYLGVPSMGAVLHTLNIRLHENDVRFVAEHAGVDAGSLGLTRGPRLGGCRRPLLRRYRA